MFKVALVIFVVGIAIWIVYSVISLRGIEEPRYSVISKGKGYEIRHYDSYIVAEAYVGADYRSGLNEGFRYIAGYIFGGNTSQSKISMTTPVIDSNISEKIAMTTPVLDSPTEDSKRKVAFVMPSEYTMDTLPKPNSDKVTLREVPSRALAVRRFSWYPSESRMLAQEEALLESLTTQGVTVAGETIRALYNPPGTIPFLLRNEVMVEVEVEL